MYPFDYQRAASVADAAALLSRNPDAKLLAGGQTLVGAMKLRLAAPPQLVSFRREFKITELIPHSSPARRCRRPRSAGKGITYGSLWASPPVIRRCSPDIAHALRD